MKLSLLADGIETIVNETKFQLTCPNCEHSFTGTPPDLLRDAELVTDESSESTQAKEAFISYYQSSITCGECELPFSTDFAYGEMQPARYLFGLYL